MENEYSEQQAAQASRRAIRIMRVPVTLITTVKKIDTQNNTKGAMINIYVCPSCTTPDKSFQLNQEFREQCVDAIKGTKFTIGGPNVQPTVLMTFAGAVQKHNVELNDEMISDPYAYSPVSEQRRSEDMANSTMVNLMLNQIESFGGDYTEDNLQDPEIMIRTTDYEQTPDVRPMSSSEEYDEEYLALYSNEGFVAQRFVATVYTIGTMQDFSTEDAFSDEERAYVSMVAASANVIIYRLIKQRASSLFVTSTVEWPVGYRYLKLMSIRNYRSANQNILAGTQPPLQTETASGAVADSEFILVSGSFNSVLRPSAQLPMDYGRGYNMLRGVTLPSDPDSEGTVLDEPVDDDVGAPTLLLS
jgi:hypothetical protein